MEKYCAFLRSFIQEHTAPAKVPDAELNALRALVGDPPVSMPEIKRARLRVNSQFGLRVLQNALNNVPLLTAEQGRRLENQVCALAVSVAALMPADKRNFPQMSGMCRIVCRVLGFPPATARIFQRFRFQRNELVTQQLLRPAFEALGWDVALIPDQLGDLAIIDAFQNVAL